MIKNKMSSYDIIGSLSKAAGEVEWLIKLSDEILEEKSVLISPIFSFVHDVSWHVGMVPDSTSAPGNTALCLYKKECQCEIRLHYSLEMILNGMQLKKWERESGFGKGEAWAGPHYLLRSVVLDQWSKKTDDCNQLIIKLRMSDKVPDKEDPLLEKRKEGMKILCQNIKDLLLHDDEHDLILKVKDREFKAHRCIMRFRCPVFKSMLSHDMLEKSSGVVEIPDCEPLAFEQFLNYVYSGDLETQMITLDESFMLGLYYIADKYDIACLKEMCCEFIKKSLSPSNVCDVIKLALNHSDSPLLECGKEYFAENAKEVLVTVEWQSFAKENFIQANELFIKIVDHYETRQKKAGDIIELLRNIVNSHQNV